MKAYTSPTRGDGAPCVPQDRLTVLRDVRGRAIGKHLYKVDNAWRLSKLKAKDFNLEVATLPPTLDALADVLQDTIDDPSAFLLRDAPAELPPGPVRRLKENFPHRTSRFMPLDFDDVKLSHVPGIPPCWTPGVSPERDRQALQAILRFYLPEPLHGFPSIAVFSASTGFWKREDGLSVSIFVPETVSFHVWFVLSEAVHADVLKAWCTHLKRSVKAPVDPSLYHAVQPIFCGPPTVHGTVRSGLPPIMSDSTARMVRLPAENCPTVCWGDERDHIPVRFILDSIPAPAPAKPARAGELARPARAADAAARDADPALARRLENYAQSTFKRLTEKLRGIEDKTTRHTALLHAARRLAGFAAVGLLDWPAVRAELAVLGRTSGTERALNYAEANPDDVSSSISDIRKSHQQQTTRRRGQRRTRPGKAPAKTTAKPAQTTAKLMSVREGRNTLPGLIAAAMKRPDNAAMERIEHVAVLQQPPGLGKTTALRRWLAESRGLYIFAAPNRRAAAEMVQQLRKDGRRSELWLGRHGPRLRSDQVWIKPGLQSDGLTVNNCGNGIQQKRIADGFSAMCGDCPFRGVCERGDDSVTSGYVSQRRIAKNMMKADDKNVENIVVESDDNQVEKDIIKAGEGVLVITQDMLPAALSLAKRSIDGVIVDEQPRLQELSLTAEDVPTLTRASPALGAVLGELLTRIGVETAGQDLGEMETMNPAARASLQAHGRIVSSIYQDALAELAVEALAALPGLKEEEKSGRLQRGLLAMVRALARRPDSVTIHARIGKPVALFALGERPDIPPGVPVIIADATADPRRIAAWAGRDVDVKTIRIKPHQELRALLIESKGLQRGELGRQAGPVLHRRLQRIADEMESNVINIERKRISYGLELSALVIHPMRLQQAHGPALDAFLERLRQRGWTVSTTHWQSTESRGSDAYNGAGLVVTLGSPRLNLTGWAVVERGLASMLGKPMPPDNPAADSRERVRWQREARAEMWQAHGRPRSFTDIQENPVLHVVVSPASDVPRALAELPPSQREHRTLSGRQATAATWLDAKMAELNLIAVHAGLMAQIPGAPSVHSLKRACQQLFDRPRHWKCAVTGGGRDLSVLSQDGVSSHAVAVSLRRIADAAGLNHLGIKSPYRVYVSSFAPNSGRPPAAPQPARKRPPRTARGIEPALTLERAPTLSDEGEPPPVKAINATEDGPPGALGSPDGERDWRTSKIPIEPPSESNLDFWKGGMNA